jgi:outer membrane PBP1 activator LpoA protein
MELILRDGANRLEMETYRTDADRVGDSATAQRLKLLLKPFTDAPATASAPDTPDSSAAAAIANRDYRGAARIYFSEMQRSTNSNQRRRFFLSGVRALQSGNLIAEALAAGESHINGLAKDRETLLFMARLALAANRPERSQLYIRHALGMSTNGGTP